MCNFDFPEKNLELVSPPLFVYEFYFSRYWAIYVLQLFVSQVVKFINFETNLMFLIKPFFYITKKSTQKFKYLENEKSF